MNGPPAARPPSWKWIVCSLLLLATMLNYMDRQTLSLLAKTIRDEYRLSYQQYGRLDSGFSLAFATGALTFGVLVDRFGVRWLYPLVLLGWSCAGIATGYADRIGAALAGPFGLAPVDTSAQAYIGFMTCRVVLGFFEAGHWPCALVTTQAILARHDRSFGNSLLQSGAALGSIFTPLIVQAVATDTAGGWRPPFVVIGLVGMFWVIPWLSLVRRSDLSRSRPAPVEAEPPEPPLSRRARWQLFGVLVVTVIAINITWQFFRVWLPMFLEEQHRYTKGQVAWFTSLYYIATDVGCIGAGFLVKWLAGRGWDVHRARVLSFAGCTVLVLLGVVVAHLPGPTPGEPASLLLPGLLLLVGAGALGLFPIYYSFAQELSRTHQGKITGTLGTITWIASALLQDRVGRSIDAAVAASDPNPYAFGLIVAGVAPLPALLALLFFWPRRTAPPAPAAAIEGEKVGRV
jgi:ACS family hexuronate transporter-like MFS transporter